MQETRHAFSLLETVITLALIAVLAGISVPLYRNYLIQNDLEIAVNQTEQMLNRARLLSQSGEEGSMWGVNAGSGILFKGSSFASRDVKADEQYPFAPTITVSGITEVHFSKIYGEPSKTGTITFTAMNGKTRSLTIQAGLGGASTIVLPGDDVLMRIDFDYIKNNGNGSAEAVTFVGPDAVRYEDGEWIPLLTDGQIHIDEGLVLGTTGFAVERRSGFVRIVADGELENGGKEVVDAYITLDKATVESVENDIGDNECENPFDGVVSNGVGGDEVTQPNVRQVFFRTRVTNYGDGILIYWKADPSRWL